MKKLIVLVISALFAMSLSTNSFAKDVWTSDDIRSVFHDLVNSPAKKYIVPACEKSYEYGYRYPNYQSCLKIMNDSLSRMDIENSRDRKLASGIVSLMMLFCYQGISDKINNNPPNGADYLMKALLNTGF